MSSLINAIVAATIISLASLIGIFVISLREAILDRMLFILISLSAGSILGTALLDLLPEAVEFIGQEACSIVPVYSTIGFISFFFLERFIYWYHGHVHGYDAKVDEKMTVKKYAILNLVGDGIHNLIDGMIIAASFLINAKLGYATTIAVALHELPQEMGDFGVLVYGGFTRYKALLFNFLSALTAVLGVFLTHYFTMNITDFVGFLISFASGAFIYLSGSELIPEMQKEENVKRSAIQFAFFVIGIILIWSLGLLIPE